MAKTRTALARRRRSYGSLPVRKNFLPLLPLVPLAGLLGLGVAGWAGYKAYTTAGSVVDTLTKPSVIVGTGLGVIAGFRASDRWLERLAFAAVGLGGGMLIDRYLSEE